jgi:hypothetical protein
MSQPVWTTPAGSLGTIPEGVFYSVPIQATSTDTVYYKVIAGALPRGMQINETGIIAGIPNSKATTQGVPLDVKTDTLSKFAIRAYTRTGSVVTGLADRTFTIEVANTTVPAFVTPPGQLAQLYDASLITNLQIEYTGNEFTVINLVSGQLPPGLSIDAKGKITGLISLIKTSFNYQFTLEATDGGVNGTVIRTFSIYVWARETLTADNYLNPNAFRADNTFITADGSPILVPNLLNPQGSIGVVRSDNFYAYQFNGIDLNGGPVQYLTDAEIPGLTLDINSGFLYGNIPPLGLNERTYSFSVRVRLKNNPDVISDPYYYSLSIIGPVSSDITWLTPSYLGSIDNGATSTLYVKAVNKSGLALQYQLASGTDSRLPQGLQLLPNGDIAGRVSFNTFALDDGTTTFDQGTTTFDMVCTFTVNVSSLNGLVNADQVFSIRVNRAYNEPYDNLYIQAMPPLQDRAVINSLLQNSDIFKQNLLYRPTDPNFGVAKNVKYYHAYGLTAATLDEYINSLNLNHYWKNLVLGSIEVAQAKDTNGNVVYEVVYSRIIDNLVNNQDQSVSKDVRLPYAVSTSVDDSVTIVYPNSLVNMRNQVIDVVGQISTTLPAWMTSKQDNGSVLGFTPAWVIAYANPGCGNQLAYYIGEDFIPKLNTIDFEVDRYELDNLLTKHWNREEQQWGPPHPSTVTTFDYGSANYNVDPWVSFAPSYYNLLTVVGNGSEVTATFRKQKTAPFTVGQTVNVSGVVPDFPVAAYSYTAQYTIGDFVNYNSVIYICTSLENPSEPLIGYPPNKTPYWTNLYGDVTVTSCTTSSFTFNSNIDALTSVGGGVATVPPVVEWTNIDSATVDWTSDYNGQPTTFDGNSLQFTAPVDMYSNTNAYDKYLVFQRNGIPARNILE